MIEKIVNAIVDQMENENLLYSEMKEHYLYALITRKMDYHYFNIVYWSDF